MTATAVGLEVDVQFGGVSIGDETARVGVKIDRGAMTLDDADEFLCGKRLTGRIEVCAPGEQQGQQSLPGMNDARPHLDGTFDVKRFGVGPKEVSAGLTFVLGSIDVSELAKFAKKNGRLTIMEAQYLPDDGEEDDGDGPSFDDHEDTGPQPKARKKSKGAVAGDSGAAMSIFELVKHGVPKKKCDALADAAGGSTIGHLEKLMREDAWWHKKAKGIGESWIDKISDAVVSFRRQNPVPSDDEPVQQELPGTETVKGRPKSKAPTAEVQAAYTAGCEAAVAGKEQKDNPHEFGMAEFTAWWNGWNDTNAGTRAK